MKKLGKAIGRFFAAIYRVIDKIIVTPISRLIFNIREYLRSKNIKLDYIFNRPNFMLYVSLILAVVMFLLILNLFSFLSICLFAIETKSL